MQAITCLFNKRTHHNINRAITVPEKERERERERSGQKCRREQRKFFEQNLKASFCA